MEAYLVRLVSYPDDVDAGLEAVVLLQAYLLFVLHDCTAHADDNDYLTLRGLNIEAAILRIDLHALDRFDTRRIFLLFRTFSFDVDICPDVLNEVFARQHTFLHFFPIAVVTAFDIDFEVVEGVVGCIFLDINVDRSTFTNNILACCDFCPVANFFYIDVVVTDRIGIYRWFGVCWFLYLFKLSSVSLIFRYSDSTCCFYLPISPLHKLIACIGCCC